MIDTDVLLAIRRKDDSKRIYSSLIQMAGDGDLKTVRQVFPELERHGEFFKFLQAKKSKFILPTEQQYCTGVQQRLDIIGRKARYLYEETGSNDPADPWLVAAASYHRYTLVTNEKQNSPKKIPAACRIPELDCRCISGPHFLYEVGLVKNINPAHISVDAFFGDPR